VRAGRRRLKKKEASRGAPFTSNRRVAPSGCFLRWEIPPGDGREEEPRDIQYPAVVARLSHSIPPGRGHRLPVCRGLVAPFWNGGVSCRRGIRELEMAAGCAVGSPPPPVLSNVDCERGGVIRCPAAAGPHGTHSATPAARSRTASRASERCALPPRHLTRPGARDPPAVPHCVQSTVCGHAEPYPNS